MTYILYILFGFLPSIIWLLFYLRKDAHPESNRMILKIFFYGMLVAIIAAVIEIEIAAGFAILEDRLVVTFPVLFFLLYHFIVIALVEEFSKFLIVKEKVINDPEFDEPVDVMLYMIIVALGFAALENLLILLPGKEPFIFQEALAVTAFRFIGATFLHALCSGALGYFLALSIFEPKKRLRLIIQGMVIATILHGLFNIFIIGIEERTILSIVSLIILLSGLAVFVSSGFRKLKKMASICKTK